MISAGRRKILWRTFLAAVITFGLNQVDVDYIDGLLFDARFRLSPSATPSDHLVLIKITPDTVERYRGMPTIEDWNRTLSFLLRHSPKAIFLTSPLLGVPSENADPARNQAGSEDNGSKAMLPPAEVALAKQLVASGQVYQLTEQMFLPGEPLVSPLSAPFSEIPILSAPRTADTALFAKDGVTRRLLLDYNQVPLGHWQIAQMAVPSLKDLAQIRGRFNLYETEQIYVDFLRPGKFKTIAFEDVLQADPQLFEQRLVLIGDDLGRALRNYVKTPYSRDPAAMSLLEMHANMVDTLVRNSAPLPSPMLLTLLLTFLVTLTTLYAVLSLRPLVGIRLLFTLAAGYFALAWLLFNLTGFLMPLSYPILSIFLSYYFFIPYRLIQENRRTWELQEKNRILSQVEELKTNFISMISHDVKTPVARIQGMTDLVVAQGSLNLQQREGIDHIRASAEELGSFINSILNYAQMESRGFELHFEVKDINNLMQEALNKLDFMAKLKKIRIQFDPAPLFPIAVDPQLIKQVFTNLVENAIKYSPELSVIKIWSEDLDGKIAVHVRDQGPGIAPQDLPYIFDKFYRSSQAKTSKVKGSGLGLYLARYLTELHQGALTVVNGETGGAHFTVTLPDRTSLSNN